MVNLVYKNVVGEIKNIIDEARRKVIREVNNVMVIAYWNVGRIIVDYEQKGERRAEYGKQLLKELSKELTKSFGKGFSISNLKSMRKFYLEYSKFQTLSGKSDVVEKKSQTMSGQSGKFTQKQQTPSRQVAFNEENEIMISFKLSWSHYLELLEVSDLEARSFYEKECINSNWSVRELRRQIDSSLFQRLLLSKGKINKEKVLQLAKEGISYNCADDFIKNPMVLEFLGVSENKPKLESDLEADLIKHIEDFLLELGRGFMFVGSQQRISVGGANYYIDMVFYNKILHL